MESAPSVSITTEGWTKPLKGHIRKIVDYIEAFDSIQHQHVEHVRQLLQLFELKCMSLSSSFAKQASSLLVSS